MYICYMSVKAWHCESYLKLDMNSMTFVNAYCLLGTSRFADSKGSEGSFPRGKICEQYVYDE